MRSFLSQEDRKEHQEKHSLCDLRDLFVKKGFFLNSLFVVSIPSPLCIPSSPFLGRLSVSKIGGGGGR
jgi:hypothetical protein